MKKYRKTFFPRALALKVISIREHVMFSVFITAVARDVSSIQKPMGRIAINVDQVMAQIYN